MITKNQTRNALGRGLGSLIPSFEISEEEAKNFITCPIDDIFVNKNQPRKFFDQDKINELSISIKEKGIIQPLIVRKIDRGYEIVTGERRYRAALLANLKVIPVIVKEYNDDDALEISLIENIQREDLNPIEEAETYQTIIERRGITHEEISNKMGKDRSTITNSLRLLNLPSTIKNMLVEKKISVGHARALLGLENPEQMIVIGKEILEKNLSVREIEKIIQNFKKKNSEEKVLESNLGTTSEENLFMEELEKNIADFLQAKVSIKGDQKKGKITISYNAQEELNSIIEKFKKITA